MKTTPVAPAVQQYRRNRDISKIRQHQHASAASETMQQTAPASSQPADPTNQHSNDDVAAAAAAPEEDKAAAEPSKHHEPAQVEVTAPETDKAAEAEAAADSTEQEVPATQVVQQTDSPALAHAKEVVQHVQDTTSAHQSAAATAPCTATAPESEQVEVTLQEQCTTTVAPQGSSTMTKPAAETTEQGQRTEQVQNKMIEVKSEILNPTEPLAPVAAQALGDIIEIDSDPEPETKKEIVNPNEAEQQQQQHASLAALDVSSDEEQPALALAKITNKNTGTSEPAAVTSDVGKAGLTAQAASQEGRQPELHAEQQQQQ